MESYHGESKSVVPQNYIIGVKRKDKITFVSNIVDKSITWPEIKEHIMNELEERKRIREQKRENKVLDVENNKGK